MNYPIDKTPIFPSKISEEDWRGKVIEAVFVGDGFGGNINRKVVEGVEGI